MNDTKQYGFIKLALTAALFLTIVSVVLSVGTAYGRYTTAFDGVQSFTAQPKASANVVQGEWTSMLNGTDTSQTMSFTVSGTDIQRETNVRIRLFIKDPPDSAETGRGNIEVFLVNNQNADTKYRAEAQYLNANTPMYREEPYNEGGWVYKFYDNSGKELVWSIPIANDGEMPTLDMNITVGFELSASELVLIVEGTEG